MADISFIADVEQISTDLFHTYCASCKDFLKENLKECDLKEPLRRMILIGKLDYANKEEIKHRHIAMVKEIQETIMEPSSKLSGLMIIDKSFFYHIAEGSDEAINEVIDRTAAFVSNKLLHDAKVIRTLNIRFRHFENWKSFMILSVDHVDKPSKQSIRKESDISTLALMIDKFEDAIFVLASYVRFLTGDDIENQINDLTPINVLPYQTELQRLYEEPFFINVQQYVERYLTPYDYTMYTEQEWPPTGPVHDATDYFRELDEFEQSIDELLKIEKEKKKQKSRHGPWWWL